MAAGASSYQNRSDNVPDNLSRLERGSYGNSFAAVRVAVPLACAAPAVIVACGPQTGQVVGLPGESVTA